MSLMPCDCSCCQDWQERMKDLAEHHQIFEKAASDYIEKQSALFKSTLQKLNELNGREAGEVVAWLEEQLRLLRAE